MDSATATYHTRLSYAGIGGGEADLERLSLRRQGLLKAMEGSLADRCPRSFRGGNKPSDREPSARLLLAKTHSAGNCRFGSTFFEEAHI